MVVCPRPLRWLGVAAAVVWPSELTRAAELQEGGWEPNGCGGYCRRCGASAGPGAATAEGCSYCGDGGLVWDSVTRLGPYEPPLDDWIRAMKFEGQWAWTRQFGAWLGDAVGGSADAAERGGGERVAVCAAPMFWLRRWRRGYNQADLIAREVARLRGWSWTPILRRTRHTPPQTVVAPSQRKSNVAGSFALAPVDLTGWRVLLVDDVLTSGATLEGCARLLRKAGAERIDVAVVAVSHPHRT